VWLGRQISVWHIRGGGVLREGEHADQTDSGNCENSSEAQENDTEGTVPEKKKRNTTDNNTLRIATTNAKGMAFATGRRQQETRMRQHKIDGFSVQETHAGKEIREVFVTHFTSDIFDDVRFLNKQNVPTHKKEKIRESKRQRHKQRSSRSMENNL
jgi:hypothetical protein